MNDQLFSALFHPGVLPRIVNRGVPRRFLNPNSILRTKKAKSDTFKEKNKIINFKRKGKQTAVSIGNHTVSSSINLHE